MIIPLLLIGLVAGILAGLLGIGGGILFTPVLFYLFKQQAVSEPVLWAVGSSLFCTFMASISSVVRQMMQHYFFLREGLMLGLLGAGGVYVGKLLLTSSFYDEQSFAIFFSLLMLYVAWSFVRRSQHTAQPAESGPGPDLTLRSASTAGGLGGVVASLAGIGGGGVMVPIMSLIFSIPLKRAVSLSSTAIVLISLSGWAQLAAYGSQPEGMTAYTLGYVDFGAALPLVGGAFLGGFGGAWINHLIPAKFIRWLFVGLALTIAIRMIWEIL